MSENVYVRIAGAVIDEAAMIDLRIRKDLTSPDKLQRQIAAWARVFEKSSDGRGAVWPKEAMDAVSAHYEKENAFPIMPGDIVAYCKRQPLTSSREHVSWWLDVWAQHPWSVAIEEAVGRPIPQLEPDSYDSADLPRLIEQRRAFINEQRNFFVDEILANAERKAITR